MHVSDVGELLVRRVRKGALQPILQVSGLEHGLLRVAKGDQWTLDPVPEGGFSLLVLDGVATCGTEDLRESLGTGHLVVFDSGDSASIFNDGPGPFVGLATSVTGEAEVAEEQE
ncbi:MAG: hypothetical protein VX938_08970 [Myxococcota bacterium]|nr:hypothetical protein [Myxococcota bacterium]